MYEHWAVSFNCEKQILFKVNWRTWPLSKTNFRFKVSLQLSSGWKKTLCRVQACLRRETLQPSTNCFNQNAEKQSWSLPRNGFSPRHWRTFINFLWLLPDLVSFFIGRCQVRLAFVAFCLWTILPKSLNFSQSSLAIE